MAKGITWKPSFGGGQRICGTKGVRFRAIAAERRSNPKVWRCQRCLRACDSLVVVQLEDSPPMKYCRFCAATHSLNGI